MTKVADIYGRNVTRGGFKSSDTHGSVALTAIGKVQEVVSSEGAPLLELFIARHPYLAEFAHSPTCAIVTVKIDSYFLVSSFQRILEWHIKA